MSSEQITGTDALIFIDRLTGLLHREDNEVKWRLSYQLLDYSRGLELVAVPDRSYVHMSILLDKDELSDKNLLGYIVEAILKHGRGAQK